jgi:chromosome segregation ATPase
VAYWHGIVVTDQSGRTPLEILQDSEMLDMEDHQVVLESLTRSLDTYEHLEDAHQQELEEVQLEHNQAMEAVKQHHAEDLRGEAEKQEQLEQEVDLLRKMLANSNANEMNQREEIERFAVIEETWRERLNALQLKYQDLERQYNDEVNKVHGLDHVVMLKNAEIEQANTRIDQLSLDLQMITAWQEREMRKALDKTQRNVRKLVDSFVGLHGILTEHGAGLKTLLETRGIEFDTSFDVSSGQEEKKTEDRVRSRRSSLPSSVASVSAPISSDLTP